METFSSDCRCQRCSVNYRQRCYPHYAALQTERECSATAMRNWMWLSDNFGSNSEQRCGSLTLPGHADSYWCLRLSNSYVQVLKACRNSLRSTKSERSSLNALQISSVGGGAWSEKQRDPQYECLWFATEAAKSFSYPIWTLSMLVLMLWSSFGQRLPGSSFSTIVPRLQCRVAR